jgi:hypothetical protein
MALPYMYYIPMAYEKKCTMSLYIPVVFNHTPTLDIEKTFDLLEIGKVTKIDRIPVWKDEVREDGRTHSTKTHDQAFVHLTWRTDSVAAMNLYNKLDVDGQSAKLVYNDPYYWALYKNRNPEQSVIREQTARIQELELQMEVLQNRVMILENEGILDTGIKDDYMPVGCEGWTEAISSPFWSTHETTRGMKGIESLEPWEGDELPDPCFHSPDSPSFSPTSEELNC